MGPDIAVLWQGIAFARDNKAVLMTGNQKVLNANGVACQLFGRALTELIGVGVTELIDVYQPPKANLAVWETTLTLAGEKVPVEVTCEQFRAPENIDVFAIRDLRSRHEATRERQLHGLVLEERDRELRVQRQIFETALKSLSQGVCVFDQDLRLAICNEAYLKTYGLMPDEARPGTHLRDILRIRIARGIYSGPSPDAFIEERLAVIAAHVPAAVTHRFPDGRIVEVGHHPMPGGGWVATHRDVTERWRIETELAQSNRELGAQNKRFDTAMNNISQGLCFFDGNQRLIVCNQRYIEMYRLPKECARAGITLREIVEHRFIAGSCPQMTAEQYLAWRDNVAVSHKSSDSIVKLMDGRTFAIHHEPMPDGGWVATHQDITEQRRTEAKIAHMAVHDALTDLPNRVLFNERLDQALARGNCGEIVVAHLFDLDNFKTVNDTLGHPAGDKLLRMTADRLRGLVRETDTIARMGGDEFAIVQTALSETDATSLARRVISRISEPYEIDGQQVVIGASVGIAIGQANGLTPDQLIRNADLALYCAKGDGRGTFKIFEPEMDLQVQARRQLEQDLRNALHAGEFELYYQPIVDIESNQITGLEALIRWNHPRHGLVMPNQFIPLAEEIGLIIPMGEWIIRNACAMAARWPNQIKIAVNLSPVQFRSPGLVSSIAAAINASGLPAERIELEVTETSLLQNSEATLTMLYQLRELGVRIAMDDFGTGYSSLSLLQSFPFDKIKIDRSFVKDITESVGSLNIVRAVTALAKGLGMTATAEGVETVEQRDTVKAEGCTEMQGYLFSQPLPASAIERLFFTKRSSTKNAA